MVGINNNKGKKKNNIVKMSFEMNSTALPIRKYPKIPQNYSNGCFSLGK